MGISTAGTRPAATAAARHPAARHVAAWQIATAVAGLLAGAGVAWVLSHHGSNSFGVPKLPFAVPVVVLTICVLCGSTFIRAQQPRPAPRAIAFFGRVEAVGRRGGA